jgi:hypothetical protein
MSLSNERIIDCDDGIILTMDDAEYQALLAWLLGEEA